jgi:hypothetical protein
MREKRFECKFCKTKFAIEQRFINHRCKHMIRDEEFRSPTGQAAWLYYQKWMKAYRRIVPKSSAFLHSKFYNSFMRFAKFVKATSMPDTDMFIWLMREEDISPTIWTNDQVYAKYLEFMDRRAPPVKQAEITINTLFELSEEYECEVGDLFDILTPNEVIHLLRQRRLSPWILLNSSKFKEFFVNRVSTEERIIMESIIRPSYWGEKFSTSASDVERMKLYVAELSL